MWFGSAPYDSKSSAKSRWPNCDATNSAEPVLAVPVLKLGSAPDDTTVAVAVVQWRSGAVVQWCSGAVVRRYSVDRMSASNEQRQLPTTRCGLECTTETPLQNKRGSKKTNDANKQAQKVRGMVLYCSA